MYNDKLEQLITLALADGELTEKEKQVLFKRAELEGIDLDEFEMVLEARMYEKTKDRTPTLTAAPKSDKLGDIKKCPGCGAITESFATKCYECGTEYRNIESSSSIIKFFEKLDEIEATRKENYSQKFSNEIKLAKVILWIFFWPWLILYKCLKFLVDRSRPAKWSTTDARKEELVLNYPVPFSKEGILEFLTLSASKIDQTSYARVFADDTKYKNTWNKIWLKKIDQINSKAAISMKGDEKTYNEVKLITENARRLVKNNSQKVYKVLGLGLLLIISLITWASIDSKIDENTNVGYSSVVMSAEKYITNKQYDEAEKLATAVDDKHNVDIRSKIQLDKLTDKLESLEPLIQQKKFSKLQYELQKLRWTKISEGASYQSKELEQVSYRIFLEKKEAINNQLPENKKIDIESKYL
ncbi:hypothetical protein [Sphingobacterium sp.]|uniref:hypothetical protein n=1 Tax=Sphingobacterium sp. TaxID=341027 RepID=UPI002585F7C2|nr:hypothetical protein [Sphingobacterium sp.]WET69785.1 MAG: hypothetical protein P0Y57_01590 [Sphingobacterium sp.]